MDPSGNNARGLPRQFTICREVQAIQYFGQSLLEAIPAGETILVECPSAYPRMIEAVRQGKRYLIFERDLAERAEPARGRADAGEARPFKQVRAIVRREKQPASSTDWFPLENIAVISALDQILPRDGEKFMVVWEERDVAASGGLTRATAAAERFSSF